MGAWFMVEAPSSTTDLETEPEKTNVTPQSPPSLPELQHLPPQNQQTTFNPPSFPPPISPSPPFPFYVSPFSGAVGPPTFSAVPLLAPPQFSVVSNYDDPEFKPPGVSSPQWKLSCGYSTGEVLAVPPVLCEIVPGVSSPQWKVSGGYKAGAVLEKPPVLYQVPQSAILQYDPMLDGYAAMPHPGLPHYPSPYMPMGPTPFAPLPPGAVAVTPGAPCARPIIPLATRPPILASITPEKPQTTVCVGKMSATANNDFMLSLLQLCGPVKSWKRADDPINGTPMAFGFCEFATADGVLRALRLLDKFNIDGRELVVNVNQSTKEYLERYVEKKSEDWKKLKETEDAGADKEDINASGAEKSEGSANFGVVTDADREMDRLVSEKLASIIEDRLMEIERCEEEEKQERMREERKQRRKAKREYAKRLKEWECIESRREKLWHYEKEWEMDMELKREREICKEEDGDDDEKWGRRSEQEEKRNRRLREMEDDLADRQREEEEIAEKMEKRKRRLREIEDDLADRQREEEEIAEKMEKRKRRLREIEDDLADRRREEEEIAQSKKSLGKKLRFGLVGSRKKTLVPSVFHDDDNDDEARKSKRVRPNCTKDDAKDKVLGLKRERSLDRANPQKVKTMRPQVHIDYSTEILQSVNPAISRAQPPNLAAAAEFAKPVSNVCSNEEGPDQERDRCSRNRPNQQKKGRDRNTEDANCTKDDTEEKVLDQKKEHGVEKAQTPDNKKVLDAKQLIDMIPKTKEELFSYEINWDVFDKHELHEIMTPWISKKIMEFMGDEEPTLVDYIVSNTQEHVKASEMFELLLPTLDEETEMFVLKMWVLLIFEIKKVETGLSIRSRT